MNECAQVAACMGSVRVATTEAQQDNQMFAVACVMQWSVPVHGKVPTHAHIKLRIAARP
jgi:hypothetical protein